MAHDWAFQLDPANHRQPSKTNNLFSVWGGGEEVGSAPQMRRGGKTLQVVS